VRYRTFGQTGFDLSTVSMGCNRLGDPGVDPAQWPPIVERAIDLGVNFFDTSISYNQGRSEQIVGDVTSRRDVRIYLGTKVGFDIDFERGREFQVKEYSAARVRRDVEGSLRRLRRNTIDAYLLHSPTVEVLRSGDWLEALTKLRRDGKVRFWGISTDDHASGLEAIRQGAQVLQVEYDLLDPTAEDALLPAAQAENVAVMVRTPLARGLLTGKFAPGQPIPPEQQWRRPRGDRLELRLGRIEQLRFLERPGQTLAQAALRFVLAHPAVHCAVPGARTVEQLEANVPAADADLTPEELARVRELHVRWRAEGRW
jgi:aryl-alcohol dehydrogenase-like predicted oxidoreductase